MFMCGMRLRAACRWGLEVSIYGQICIKPIWRQMRLAGPIVTINICEIRRMFCHTIDKGQFKLHLKGHGRVI